MKTKLGLSCGMLTLAVLAGCSQNSSLNSDSASNTLTIQGTVQSAALEDLTVTDAGDTVVATATTSDSGAYSVTVNGSEVTFPLTITVIHDGDTFTTIIPEPKDANVRGIHAKLDTFSRAAFDSARAQGKIADLDEDAWKALVAAACASMGGDSTDTTTSCAMIPPEREERGSHQHGMMGDKHHGMHADSSWDTLPVCADSVLTELHALADSLRAERDAGTLSDSTFHAIMDANRPTTCRPPHRHHRGEHVLSTDTTATDTTTTDTTSDTTTTIPDTTALSSEATSSSSVE